LQVRNAVLERGKMKFNEMYKLLERKFAASFPATPDEKRQEQSIWQNVFLDEYGEQLFCKAVESFLLNTPKIWPGDNLIAMIREKCDLLKEIAAEQKAKAAQIEERRRIEHKFYIHAETKVKTAPNREHSGDCAMAGKGTFCCDSCLKSSDLILQDPLFNELESVKWAVNVDLKEYANKSKHYREPTKLPDRRMPQGFRIDRRWPEDRGELDPVKAQKWQDEKRAMLDKYYAELRTRRSSAEKPKGA